MIVLTAAVLGVNLGIFAALYWQKAATRRRERARLGWLKQAEAIIERDHKRRQLYYLTRARQRYERGLDRSESILCDRLRGYSLR